MSSGEILVILIVALIVFGPKKLPMLAMHLGLLLRKMDQLKADATALWQQQLKELQLEENQRRAKEADERYKKNTSLDNDYEELNSSDINSLPYGRDSDHRGGQLD